MTGHTTGDHVTSGTADQEALNRATAHLTIDLGAIVGNWRRLKSCLHRGAACAAVVKADAYGCGATRVVPALVCGGCTDFFVAQIDEALAIRPLVPQPGRVFVLSGPPAGAEDLVREAGIIPVLNSPDQIARYGAACVAAGLSAPAPVVIHVDTGMTRLGLSERELAALVEDPAPLAPLRPVLVMSHLACADTPEHPLNAAQRDAFALARAAFPGVPGSLANSSGIFLGADWQADLARPGVALYGGNPTPGSPNPVDQVVRLQGKILQVRQIDTPRTVGYGATLRAGAGTRIATVGVGYADGFPRAAGNRATGLLAGHRVSVVGRVSMDLLTFDVSHVPEPLVRPGQMIELIGPDVTVDDLAGAADTIGYEVLTRLGARYPRTWIDPFKSTTDLSMTGTSVTGTPAAGDGGSQAETIGS